MKITRIALTVTFTPALLRGKTIEKGVSGHDLKLLLYDAMHSMNREEFAKTVGVWDMLKGDIEEQDVTENSLELLDRTIIHQMNVDQAKTILTNPQTLEAMLLVFSKLSAATIPGSTLKDDTTKITEQ